MSNIKVVNAAGHNLGQLGEKYTSDGKEYYTIRKNLTAKNSISYGVKADRLTFKGNIATLKDKE